MSSAPISRTIGAIATSSRCACSTTSMTAGRWCDDRGTTDIEDCASRIRLALDDAMTELSDAYGQDMSAWRWGDAHKAIHVHRPLGNFPVVGGTFNREAEMDGGAFTLLRAANAMGGQGPTPPCMAQATARSTIWARPTSRSTSFRWGNRGTFISPHYDDLLGLWAAAQYITIPTTPDAVSSTAAHALWLEPATPVSASTNP